MYSDRYTDLFATIAVELDYEEIVNLNKVVVVASRGN